MRLLNWLMLLLAMAIVATPARSQDSTAPESELIGTWYGPWTSDSVEGTGGSLWLRFELKDGAIPRAQARQTRPHNAHWRCSELYKEVELRRDGETYSFQYRPGGRCSVAHHRFVLKNGRIEGTYTTESGRSSAYSLARHH